MYPFEETVEIERQSASAPADYQRSIIAASGKKPLINKCQNNIKPAARAGLNLIPARSTATGVAPAVEAGCGSRLTGYESR